MEQRPRWSEKSALRIPEEECSRPREQSLSRSGLGVPETAVGNPGPWARAGEPGEGQPLEGRGEG